MVAKKNPGRPKVDEATKQKARKKRAVVPIQRDPATSVKPARPGTKIAYLIEALSDPKGKTLQELSTLLSRSGSAVNINQVRTWLTYDLCDQKGYGLRSQAEEFDTGAKGDDGKPVMEQTLRIWIIRPAGEKSKVA